MASEQLRIGVFVCDCGSNIGGVVNTEALREYSESLPDVVVSVRNKYTCADPGQQEVQRTIYEHNLNRVVVASCSPTSYEAIFRECIEKFRKERKIFLTPDSIDDIKTEAFIIFSFSSITPFIKFHIEVVKRGMEIVL